MADPLAAYLPIASANAGIPAFAHHPASGGKAAYELLSCLDTSTCFPVVAQVKILWRNTVTFSDLVIQRLGTSPQREQVSFPSSMSDDKCVVSERFWQLTCCFLRHLLGAPVYQSCHHSCASCCSALQRFCYCDHVSCLA